MHKNKKAFTLVELLVAMAIIGVLIGLAIFGMTAALRSQRDAERKSAVSDINIGITAYLEAYNVYPNRAVFAATTVTLTNSTVLPLATKKIVIPLKGAAQAKTAAATAKGATDNPNNAIYTLDFIVDPLAGSTNPSAAAVCAQLESGGITCAGPGALKGATLKIVSTAVTGLVGTGDVTIP